jgi:hypothetical protein
MPDTPAGRLLRECIIRSTGKVADQLSPQCSHDKLRQVRRILITQQEASNPAAGSAQKKARRSPSKREKIEINKEALQAAKLFVEKNFPNYSHNFVMPLIQLPTPLFEHWLRAVKEVCPNFLISEILSPSS